MAKSRQQPNRQPVGRAPLGDALLVIAEDWEVNLVIGNDVQGTVNGAFRQTALHEILDSILLANGYAYRPVGQSLVVMKLESLGQWNPLFETTTIPLKMLSPADVLEGAKLLSSPHGKIFAVEAARSLTVMDFPDRVAKIRNFVHAVDARAAGEGTAGSAQTTLVTYSPQYIKVTSLATAAGEILAEEGKVALVEEENRMTVIAPPAKQRMIGELVTQHDRPRKQVRITALIYDIGLEDLHEVGVNWGHAVKGSGVDADGNPMKYWSMASALLPAGDAATNGAMTFFTTASHFDLNAVARFLNGADDSRLLADPNVVVLDHEEASIQIVTEHPLRQLTETSMGGQIGSTEFREAGVTLTVTPRIADDGTIQLAVTPSFSRLTGYTEGDSVQPIFDKREATTTVRVATTRRSSSGVCGSVLLPSNMQGCLTWRTFDSSTSESCFADIRKDCVKAK